MGEVERPQHNLLQRCGVLGQANGPVCAPWSDPMRHDQAAGWGHDVEAVRAETPPNLNVGADKARWGRVVVAPHRHQRVVSDLAGHGHVGRIADVTVSRKVAELSLIHISEPTRLLSISYAVFCLIKKKYA